MSKIIEIEELGFPKSLIIREKSLVSELIDTNDLVKELNEQLRQYNVVGQSEQLCPECKSENVEIDYGLGELYCHNCENIVGA